MKICMVSIRMTTPETCNTAVNFHDCQLAIVRDRAEKLSDIQKKAIAGDNNVINMLNITREFIRRKRLVCYGGSAINDILPPDERFYDPVKDVPDYDFYSMNALDDAIELADIFYKKGYANIEAKSGVHHGTYKVFADFVPVADITQIPTQLFKKLQKEAMVIKNIHYTPPDFLRMSMHLELSRPLGDVSRWEKIAKRLELLDRYYPIRGHVCTALPPSKMTGDTQNIQQTIFNIVNQQGGVFFGAFAAGMFLKNGRVGSTPSFDVIVNEPSRVLDIVKAALANRNLTLTVDHRKEVAELIPEHYILSVNGSARLYLYKPIACHNYNVIKINSFSVRVATIDTILAFYLAFVYVSGNDYNTNRLMCLSQQLHELHRNRHVSNKPIMRRYTLPCVGKQPTLRDMMVTRSKMHTTIKNKKSREYMSWFLKYDPSAPRVSRSKKGGTRKNRK